jgi:hypothetical protein
MSSELGIRVRAVGWIRVRVNYHHFFIDFLTRLMKNLDSLRVTLTPTLTLTLTVESKVNIFISS